MIQLICNAVESKVEKRREKKKLEYGENLQDILEYDGEIMFFLKWPLRIMEDLIILSLIFDIFVKADPQEQRFFYILMGGLAGFSLFMRIFYFIKKRTYFLPLENELEYCTGFFKRHVSYEELREAAKKRRIRIFTSYMIPKKRGHIKIQRNMNGVVDGKVGGILYKAGIIIPYVDVAQQKWISKTVAIRFFSISGVIIMFLQFFFQLADSQPIRFTIVSWIGLGIFLLFLVIAIISQCLFQVKAKKIDEIRRQEARQRVQDRLNGIRRKS